MKLPRLPKWLQISILVGVIAAAGVNLSGKFFAFRSRQAHLARIHLAQVHADIIEQKLRNDPRFREISLSGASNYGGHINVSGIVNSNEDLAELEKIVRDSQPPFFVKFRVLVNYAYQEAPPH